MKMKKSLISIFCFLFLTISCSSVPYKIIKPKKGNDVIEAKGFSIMWNVSDYKFPDAKKGYLIITNPTTGKKFKISYRDFLIMKKAYKNWRIVEETNPVITNIEEKKDKIHVTFNYMNKNKSILSGEFIVDMKYIKNKQDEKIKIYLTAGLVGSGVMNVIMILLLFVLL